MKREKKNHLFPFNTTQNERSDSQGIHLPDNALNWKAEASFSLRWNLPVPGELVHFAPGLPNEVR